jgi:hypothetical protein
MKAGKKIAAGAQKRSIAFNNSKQKDNSGRHAPGSRNKKKVS